MDIIVINIIITKINDEKINLNLNPNTKCKNITKTQKNININIKCAKKNLISFFIVIKYKIKKRIK
jgi:hypothetical protein